MPFAERFRGSSARRSLAVALAALTLGTVAACDDNSSQTTNTPPAQRRAETSVPQATPSTPRTAPQPPSSTPGAAPSAQRLIGTWTVTQSQGGPADGRSDRSETTTYRFEEGGRVTVAGSKQCAYAFQDTELKVDCQGQISAGKVEFRGKQTMLWSVGKDHIVTLTKR